MSKILLLAESNLIWFYANIAFYFWLNILAENHVWVYYFCVDLGMKIQYS